MHLKEFFKKYIEGTPEKALVADRKIFLCCLTKAVMKGVDINCSVKKIGNEDYLCSIEIVKIPPAVFGEAVLGISEYGIEKEREEIQIATAFRLRDDKYTKNYTLLWDWGNGNPHRSALDAPVKGSTNAPQ